MTFKEGYRLEKVYFENIYTLLNMLKSVDKNNVDMNTVKELLDNAIADNESIILIYKNLGELYSEVADNYSKLLADLEALKENLESWKDEINEKIDDLNNYIMSLIRDIEQRLDSLEQRMSDAEEAIDSLEDRMDTAEADIDALEGRMDTAEDDIDALEGRMDTAEDDIDSLEGRMDTAEDDIDDLETNKQDKLTAGNGITIDSNNEISVDTSVVQPKLTEGFGIDIDSNNEISVDTNDVQEKLIAGQNITLTPDATDPTKTVISATGTTYSEGTGIDIDSNNVISADTTVLQEKLVAGSGISIDPNTNEITNTAQGASYSADYGINIGNDNKISFKTPGLDASSANFGSNTFSGVTFSKGYNRNTYSGTLNSGNVSFGSQEYLTLNGLGFYVNANNQQVSTFTSGLIMCILSCSVSIWAGSIGSTPKRQYLYIKNVDIPGVIEIANGSVDFTMAYRENILIPAIYNVRKEFGNINGQYNMTLRLIPLTTYTDSEILDIINSEKRYLNVALHYNYGNL